MASTLKKQHLAIVLLIMLGALASPAMSGRSYEATMLKKHEQWMAQHGRVYESNAEKKKRLKIFKDNVNFIESFNKEGNSTYKLGINKFADLTKEEFLASYTGYKTFYNQKLSKNRFRYENQGEVPESMDWRKKGAVTDVKDQGQCGCCWAFSAVAAIEGITQIKIGRLISLSEQQILDCDGEPGGCNGNSIQHAFYFVVQNRGITTTENYPYKAMEENCKTAIQAAAMITGSEQVPPNDEAALLNAVANQPIAVAVDASRLQHYSSGIITGECGTRLTHAITAVGYGTSEDGTKYWLFKNSWGTNWGERGYVRLERDVEAKEGMCGIAMQAFYPTA